MGLSIATTAPSSMHGAVVPIGYATVSGSTSDIAFTNIPQSYQDLMFVINARGTYNAANVLIQAYLNGNYSTSNYSNTYLRGDGASASSGRATNGAGAGLGILPAATSTSGIFGSIVGHILNYSNTSTYKTIISRAAGDANGSGTTEMYTNLVRSTSAITSLNIATFGVGNFATGTTIELFGVRTVGQ